MIELVLVVCLKTSPLACDERSLMHMPAATPMGCMVQAIPQIAHWTEAHPAFVVKKWSCRYTDDRPIRA